jgi:hypothetical protein
MKRVSFINCAEVHMGSPYRVCDIQLALDWEPDLPTSGFQDVSAESPDGRYLALVEWRTQGDGPAFVVHTLDTTAREVATSELQLGACRRLWWDGGVRWDVGHNDA